MKTFRYKVLRRSVALCAVILIVIGITGVDAAAQMPPKAKERIEMLKRTRLTDVLYLNEQDAEKFFAKYDQSQKKVEDAREQLRSAVADLENSVQKKSDDMTKKCEIVFEKQTALNTAMIEKIRSMKSILTDEQYGKLVIFEHNFPLQLQKMLMKRAKKSMSGESDD